MEQIEQLVQMLRDSKRVVFFGGAGVSTASHIPDFRSSDGLYSKKLNKHFTPEQAVSHTFLVRYPEEFYDFYKQNLIYPEAKPNGCHKALAALEEMGKLAAVVTQNIDGLHQMAGSKTVYELHGSVHRNYCSQCGKRYDGTEVVLQAEGIPRCSCGGTIRPDVVLYEEGLDQEVWTGALQAIAEADMMIVGGTSLIVYPAASLIQYFQGNYMVQINKTKTNADQKADLSIHDDIAKVMEEAVQRL